MVSITVPKDVGILVRAIDSFKFPDGSRDIQKRREAMTVLVTSLNFSDRRFLEYALRSQLTTQDMIRKLPVDLILNLSDFFTDPLDFLEFLRVSRSWSHIWSGKQVVKNMLEAHFPGSLKGAPGGPDGVAEDVENPSPAFIRYYRETCRKTLRRQRGRFDSTIAGHWRFPRDMNFQLTDIITQKAHDEEFYRHKGVESPPVEPEWGQYVYHGGRFAWLHKNFIVVDTLHTMKRIMFQVPPNYKLTGPKIQLEAISDKILVVRVARTMLLWDLESHDMQTLTLPNQPTGCYVGGDVVGIIISNWDIYVYHFGKELKQLKLPDDLKKSFKKRQSQKGDKDLGIIINPDIPDTIFVASVKKGKNESMMYSVAKFKDLKFVQKWDKESFRANGGWCSLRCHKANNASLYTILLESSETFVPCGTFAHESSAEELYNYCHELCFDTKKETFYGHHYHVPYADDVFEGIIDISDKFKTWNGRMIVNLDHSEDMSTTSACDIDLHATVLIAALPSCELGQKNASEHSPFRRIGDPIQRHAVKRHPLLCCWDPCPDLDLEFLLEPWQESFSAHFEADDDFVVTFGPHGYSAWSFGTNMEVPKKESELRDLYGMPREVLDMDDGWEDETDDMLDNAYDHFFGGGMGMMGGGDIYDDDDDSFSGDSDDDGEDDDEDDEEDEMPALVTPDGGAVTSGGSGNADVDMDL